MKKRYLIILAIIATLVGLVGLGLTHQHVVKLAQTIIAKDKVGDPTTTDINSLTNYVHNHTRASVTFNLDGSYQRAVQAAEQAAVPSANGAVYNAALAACQVKDPVKTASCIENYVQSHAAPGAQPQPPVLPNYASFGYHLSSPAWAPDLAGISFLVAVVSLTLALWLGFFRYAGRPSY